jgi:hypothetical protein
MQGSKLNIAAVEFIKSRTNDNKFASLKFTGYVDEENLDGKIIQNDLSAFAKFEMKKPERIKNWYFFYYFMPTKNKELLNLTYMMLKTKRFASVVYLHLKPSKSED